MLRVGCPAPVHGAPVGVNGASLPHRPWPSRGPCRHVYSVTRSTARGPIEQIALTTLGSNKQPLVPIRRRWTLIEPTGLNAVPHPALSSGATCAEPTALNAVPHPALSPALPSAATCASRTTRRQQQPQLPIQRQRRSAYRRALGCACAMTRGWRRPVPASRAAGPPVEVPGPD